MTARSPSLKRISLRRSSKVLMMGLLNSLSYWKFDMDGNSAQNAVSRSCRWGITKTWEVGSICTVWEGLK